MDNLCWIHLSDLHITKTPSKSSAIKVLHSLVEDAQKVTSSERLKPSFIFITGDLTSGGQPEDFDAVSSYLDKLLDAFDLRIENVFIVPGNHDVYLKSSQPLNEYVNSLRRNLLNSATQVVENKEVDRAIIKRFKNYLSFIEQKLPKEGVFESTYPYYVRTLDIRDKRLAIAGINTAWLVNSNPYRDLAIIGVKQLEDVLTHTKDADIRIALMHHSPQSLWQGDQQRVVSMLLSEFGFLLHGHIHRSGERILSSGDTRATIIGAGASMTFGYQLSELSYNIVSLGLEDGVGQVFFRRYRNQMNGWCTDMVEHGGSRGSKVSFLFSERVPVAKVDSSEKAEPSSPLPKKTIIMHLSDLQFGRHHVTFGPREPLYSDDRVYEKEIEKLLTDMDRVKKAYGLSPDFIVITGDIAEWSSEVEYEVASNFIRSIAEKSGQTLDRVIMVPGNHDINRKLCQSERLKAEAFDEKFLPPYFAKFHFYQKFHNGLYAEKEDTQAPLDFGLFSEQLFIVRAFSEYRILFLGLNSCVKESEREEDHYGWISTEQVSRSIRICNQQDPERKFLRIALMHHNFRRDSYFDQENLRDSDELEIPLLNGGFRLLLHGHQHAPKALAAGVAGNSMHVLATGSAGLDAETLPENARRYQYIVIDESTVEVYRRRFDATALDETGRGCWVADPIPEDSPLFQGGPANLSFPI